MGALSQYLKAFGREIAANAVKASQPPSGPRHRLYQPKRSGIASCDKYDGHVGCRALDCQRHRSCERHDEVHFVISFQGARCYFDRVRIAPCISHDQSRARTFLEAARFQAIP